MGTVQQNLLELKADAIGLNDEKLHQDVGLCLSDCGEDGREGIFRVDQQVGCNLLDLPGQLLSIQAGGLKGPHIALEPVLAVAVVPHTLPALE